MIGVLSDAAEAAAVAEFFQLFKTPWEPYSAEHSYDVVVTSIDPGAGINARLLVIFGSKSYSSDTSSAREFFSEAISIASLEEEALPIYGELAAFEKTEFGKACALAQGEVVGFSREHTGGTVIRLGYDLFKEIGHLLSHKQPLENARVPTFDLHIHALRRWILDAGISFVEIPPAPAGSPFIVCLTHDIDFVGIRNHRFDHTMFGFLFRGTFGALNRFIRGRIGLGCLMRSWAAVISLPLVYLGWRKDFWLPFEWYLQVEKDLGATYYFIPFKGRGGDKIPARVSSLRATAYDLSNLSDWLRRLQEAGCEIGVHGIDAWHDPLRAREELDKVSSISGTDSKGIRMHWLLCDGNTPEILDEAGYDYDSTAGYNDEVGYGCGTNQVYQPPGARRLLELPLHVQDGALFYPAKLDLPEASALRLCEALTQHAFNHGGVFTILWHDRSFGPERFWGEFYVSLISMLKQSKPWFATARDAVDWFRARRAITFERNISTENNEEVVAHYGGALPSRAFAIKVNRPGLEGDCVEAVSSVRPVTWTGSDAANLTALLHQQANDNATTPVFRDNRPEPVVDGTRREVIRLAE